jgi:hypothetical protein
VPALRRRRPRRRAVPARVNVPLPGLCGCTSMCGTSGV